jgi:hypothetical protein
MSDDLAPLLVNVRRAYRLLIEYHRRVIGIVNEIGATFKIDVCFLVRHSQLLESAPLQSTAFRRRHLLATNGPAQGGLLVYNKRLERGGRRSMAARSPPCR